MSTTNIFFRNEVRNQIHGYHDRLRRQKVENIGQGETSQQNKPNDAFDTGPTSGIHGSTSGLRTIDSLGEVGRILFPNYTWFNKVQSLVLDSVFYSNRSVSRKM